MEEVTDPKASAPAFALRLDRKTRAPAAPEGAPAISPAAPAAAARSPGPAAATVSAADGAAASEGACSLSFHRPSGKATATATHTPHDDWRGASYSTEDNGRSQYEYAYAYDSVR